MYIHICIFYTNVDVLKSEDRMKVYSFIGYNFFLSTIRILTCTNKEYNDSQRSSVKP